MLPEAIEKKDIRDRIETTKRMPKQVHSFRGR